MPRRSGNRMAEPFCKVEGCKRLWYGGKGYCNLHYLRLKKHGDPLSARINHKDYHVEAYFYECRRSFTLEELYQAFKARLKDELMVDVPGTSHYGLLADKRDDEAYPE